MTCVAPGILALVPESQAQTEREIDESGRAREREKKDTSLRMSAGTYIGKRFGCPNMFAC